MRISKLHIILVLIGLVFAGSFFIFPNRTNHDNEEIDNDTMACTEEVKTCSDGTVVGRVTSSCEFAACPSDNDDNVIGGERDEYGCLVPAGYAFAESIGACAREWEIKAEDKQKAAQTAVEYIGFEKGLTVIEVEVLKCLGCFKVNLDRNGERVSVSLWNWEVSLAEELEPQIPAPEKDKDSDISVSIENDFGTKIVYGTNQSVDTAPLMKDCEWRGGVFNTCGTPCELKAEICISVCALTCESIPTNPK